MHVRDVTESDLALLASERGVKPPAIAKLRDRHHSLARCLAQGMSNTEASAVTGYDPSRVSILKADPTFRELISHYRSKEDSALADWSQRAASLSLMAVDEMTDRLEEAPEDFTVGQLLEVTKVLADRTGHAPVQKVQQTNINVELGNRMLAARQRLANLSEIISPVIDLQPVRGDDGSSSD